MSTLVRNPLFALSGFAAARSLPRQAVDRSAAVVWALEWAALVVAVSAFVAASAAFLVRLALS